MFSRDARAGLVSTASPMTNAGRIGLDQSVIVSDQSFASTDPYDIISSNIELVNALFGEHLRADEIPPDALRSYYVDYYLTQVENGGFSQFVYNSRWSPLMNSFIREGLAGMKAVRHLALFDESAALIDRFEPDRLQTFFESDYFDTNPARDALDANNDRFCELLEIENLVALNAAWLRSLPNLRMMTAVEIEAEVARRAAALPDREQRVRAALENEPRYLKLIRALCGAAGHELARVTGGDPTHEHNGTRVLAWHFLTDKGHHYMVDADGKAVMFDGTTKEMVTEVEAP
jgi:hypothetical protein